MVFYHFYVISRWFYILLQYDERKNIFKQTLIFPVDYSKRSFNTHFTVPSVLRSPSISVIETNTLVVWFGNIWYECRRGSVVPEEIFIHLRGKSWYFQRLWNDVTFSSHAFVTYIVKLQNIPCRQKCWDLCQ